MMKKLTISISEEVYNGLHAKIGTGKISKFIDNLARPHVLDENIAKGYQAMADDQSREQQANDWAEGLIRETW